MKLFKSFVMKLFKSFVILQSHDRRLLSRLWTTMLSWLRGCACTGWSVPLLLQYAKSRFVMYWYAFVCWQTYRIYYHLFYSILFYPITLLGRWGTTDDFETIPFHLVLSSTALVELAKSIPVHTLVLSSHLFFCLPLLLFPFIVPFRIVFAKPEDLETWPNNLSFRFLTSVRSSSYSPIDLLGSSCEPPHWLYGPCTKCLVTFGSN